MKVNSETEVTKLAFRIANKLDYKRDQSVEVIGAGPAIFKVIKTVEFLKSVLADVHISVDLAEMQCEFVYEPLFENLKEVREIKGKAAIKATFSFVES